MHLYVEEILKLWYYNMHYKWVKEGEKMPIIANIIGGLAVLVFALGFQCKTRRYIIITNVFSRVLYILQYLILGAFSGAVFDLIGAFATLFAQHKDRPFLKKFKFFIWIVTALILVIATYFLYENPLSFLPLFGVVLEIVAVWFTKEKHIRIAAFLAQPFWFSYNLLNCAFGSAAGNVFTMISIIIALVRFFKKDKP